jgi:pimeloyl-ACP methyl ester carboxylesterase
MAVIAFALSAAAGLGSLALWGFQARLIYPAPHYGERGLRGLPAGLTVLRDPSDPASVVGFYREPTGGGPPSKLWVAFGGNGDLALRWDPLLAPAATNGIGILMVEYPGYGARPGRPTPEALLAGGETTFKALAQHVNVDEATLQARTSVLGYSLGSAVALSYAALHPVQRIVLVSPFTSMLDMARRLVGEPLCHLLRHRYDNLASLRAVREHGHPPLTILHGERDSFIPSQMGEALAAADPGSRFELVPGANHGDVVDLAAERLRALLAE